MRTLLAIRCVLVASAASTLLAQSDTAKAPTTGFAHADEVRYVAFDSSGKWLVSMDESVVKTWRLPEGKRVTQAVVEGGASVVRISPTEPLVAILRRDYAVELRTLPGLELVRSWKTNQSTSCLAFSHDGSNVATCAIGGVRFWDTATGTQIRQIESKEEQFESKEVFDNLAFSPDGKWLATSGQRDFWSGNPRVSLWQLSDLTRVRTMGSHPDGAYFTLSFTPDSNYLVAGSNKDQWSLWGVPSGKPASIRDGPNGYWTVTPGTDGATLLSADGGRVQVWNLPGGAQRLAFEAHQGQIYSITASPDGAMVATAGKDRAIRIWMLADGSLVQQLVDRTSAAKTTTTEAKDAASPVAQEKEGQTAEGGAARPQALSARMVERIRMTEQETWTPSDPEARTGALVVVRLGPGAFATEEFTLIYRVTASGRGETAKAFCRGYTVGRMGWAITKDEQGKGFQLFTGNPTTDVTFLFEIPRSVSEVTLLHKGKPTGAPVPVKAE